MPTIISHWPGLWPDRHATADRPGWLPTAFKGAVSAGILLYAIRGALQHGLGEGVRHFSVPSAALALTAFLLIPVLGGVRWWCVLRAIGQSQCSAATLSRLFSVSIVMGQVMPSLAGDGLRGWLLVRRGVSFQAALHSIIFERGLMVLCLLALLAATQALVASRLGIVTGLWMAPLCLALGITLVLLMVVADGLLPQARPWLRPVHGVLADTRALLTSWSGIGGVAVALLSNLNFVVAGSLLAAAVGLPLSWQDSLAVIPLVTVATTLPISLGGWGMREGVLVSLLGSLGIPGGEALRYALLFGVGGLLAGMPGFLMWWFGGGAGMRRRAA